jgi:hypothetical protein
MKPGPPTLKELGQKNARTLERAAVEVRARSIISRLKERGFAVPPSIDSSDKLMGLLTAAGPELMLRAMERLIEPKRFHSPGGGYAVPLTHVEGAHGAGPGSATIERNRDGTSLFLYVVSEQGLTETWIEMDKDETIRLAEELRFEAEGLRGGNQ